MPTGGSPSASVAAEPDGVRDAPHTRGQAPSVPGVKMPWLSPQPIGLGVRWPWGALRPSGVGIGGSSSCRRRAQRHRRGATVPQRRGAQTKRTSGEEQGLSDAPICGANGAVWPENGGRERRMPAGGFPILYDTS